VCQVVALKLVSGSKRHTLEMEREVLDAMKGAMGFPKLRLVFDWQFYLELKGPTKRYTYIVE
jgi:hypothetical protein